jgi:hypothetical protein
MAIKSVAASQKARAGTARITTGTSVGRTSNVPVALGSFLHDVKERCLHAKAGCAKASLDNN